TVLNLRADTTTSDPSDRLSVQGEYYTDYATIDKTYDWSISGDAVIDSTFDYNGLKVAVSFPATSADSTIYTLNVDDGEFKGSIEIKVCRSLELTDKGFCQ